MLARYMPWLCVRPSVILSVTSGCSIKTPILVSTQTTTHGTYEI